MAIRSKAMGALALGMLLVLAACSEGESGPIVVSAIGEPPTLVNPNLEPLDAASAFLMEATAQGLVQFDETGQVQPALAQSWIVSDDGLRYTFRLTRMRPPGQEEMTAEDVTRRLRAALSRASSNPLKAQLALIDDIEAMTDDVLEISLKSPRPNFLQLLAQPEMGIVLDGKGTGPFVATPEDGAVLLSEHRENEEEGEGGAEPHGPPIILRGESAAMAVARFRAGLADLVIGGTVGNLPVARAAEPDAAALRFDPVAGLFGLVFTGREGMVADPSVRRALSMAVDRAGLIAAMNVPELQPRLSLVPEGMDELPQPTQPDWAANPLPMRREQAAQAIAAATEGEQPILRVAVPEGLGYRLVFAHLRRDWRAIGVEARRVAPGEEADLRLLDRVAPAMLVGWYLRRFTCDRSAVCSPEADLLLQRARTEQSTAGRQALLAAADRLLADATAFIPIGAPVRWSLVSPRLTGFAVNPFSRHLPSTLVAPEP